MVSLLHFLPWPCHEDVGCAILQPINIQLYDAHIDRSFCEAAYDWHSACITEY